MTTATHTAILSTVSGLSDNQLLEQTGKLAALDHQIQVFVIDHLLEMEARKLYLRRGFSSLFDYVARGLGYSDAAAWRRINAMKLCAHVGGARERLRDGSLTLDAAAQLQAAFERRDRELARRAGAGAARQRNGSAPSAPALVPPPERKPLPELDVSARKALVEEAAGKSTRQVMRMLAEVDPDLAVPADRVRALSGGRWELKAVIDEECRRGLEQLKGLLSHVDPRMTLGQLVGRLVKEGLDRHDPARPPRRRAQGSRSAGAEQSSAPKQEANPDGAAALAERSTQPAGADASPGRKQSDAEHRAASGPKSQGDSGRQAPSAVERSARPACRATSAPKSCAPGRAIPAAVKRQIWQRDGGRCRYVDPGTGRRCASRYLLQIHHILPYALGGGAEPGNLRLLCAAHHRRRHTEPASPRGPAACVALPTES